MPTLAKLVELGSLVRIEVELDGAQPWRTLLGTPDFVEWLDKTLPTLATAVIGGDLTPEQQIDALFFDYIRGEPIQFDRRFKKLNPLKDHIWELKTVEVRVFGWVPQKDFFVCCSAT